MGGNTDHGRHDADRAIMTMQPNGDKDMAQVAGTSRNRRMPPGPARRAEHTTVLGFLLALCFSALASFAWLAAEVVHQALNATNQAILLAIHADARPDFDTIALGITNIGSVPVMALLALGFIGLFLYKGRSIDAITLAAVMGGGALLIEGFKHLFHMARPALFPQLVHESGYSFPSGHSTLSFCLFGFLALWLVLEGPRRPLNWLGALICLVFPVTIAGTRLYLGVHWPSDVLAGMLLASFWITACMAGRQVALANRSEDTP
jgi:undecaprenyl-diphosphatase